jgi:transcriptional regulator with XRE-family HTH domain
MSREFGQFCRALRKRTGLTQSRLAQKASLALRTIIYWETGEREPRSEELAVALAALAATPSESEQAYRLLTSARGVQLARQQIRTQSGGSGELRGLPDLGDLLVALRIRIGLSREELAAQMEVKVSTIAGWERTEHLPDDDNLVRLCVLLGALPEERVALLTRRLVPAPRETVGSLEELATRVEMFRDAVEMQGTLLIDLHGLALKREIGLAAARRQRNSDQGYQRLAARVDTSYSVWLLHQNRMTEAEQCVQRALNLIRQEIGTCDFMPQLLNVASCCTVMKRNRDYDEGIQLLRHWLPGVTQPQWNALVYCDLSYYAAAAGHHMQALLWLQQAKNSIIRVTPEEELRYYYSVTLARVMAHTDRIDDALRALPDRCELQGQAVLFPTLIRAEIFWQAGLRTEAHDVLQDLYTDLDCYASPMIRGRADLLARQL